MKREVINIFFYDAMYYEKENGKHPFSDGDLK